MCSSITIGKTPLSKWHGCAPPNPPLPQAALGGGACGDGKYYKDWSLYHATFQLAFLGGLRPPRPPAVRAAVVAGAALKELGQERHALRTAHGSP
ncbi:hypothetical protein COCSUDRAFT_55132 [Coccomyxa subellipsoidea C-169]|uniref:Uncharacterized protein n=1 Tax=Coccomyxa subellipsoidea (strain C-169) TaxID=574566 RepID=I0Z8Z0_COCSC|nr:hypothetical protein COCSUDRAFT_55132 [Coccomyxa subellipsoidea C-169]EIE27109.1 hypothetical protein COCSUDRAFT_55132 [Coccomyxa subellipsoidea C-169]|eukprot:XP_005651653.1 hypothetical protein COCSUDRAFT_55132 [Coccomyxa subellipsoidea C-169]